MDRDGPTTVRNHSVWTLVDGIPSNLKTGRDESPSWVRIPPCVWRITDFPRISNSPHTGQQMDVPLSLGARGRSAFGRGADRTLDDADGGRRAARQRDSDGSRPDGQSRIFRRLESPDRAANRGLLP